MELGERKFDGKSGNKLALQQKDFLCDRLLLLITGVIDGCLLGLILLVCI